MADRLRRLLRYVFRAILITIAGLYFLIDLLFLSFLRPLRRRVMALHPMQRLREQIDHWNRWAVLLLLLVPWLILEPIKPLAFYLFAHRHHTYATLLIVGGEVVKLTLLDQIFDVTRPKLMTFTWFARGYEQWCAVIGYIRSLPVFRRFRAWYRVTRAWVRRRLHLRPSTGEPR